MRGKINLFRTSKMLFNKQQFAFHSKFLIIGAGTGGLSVAGQLFQEGLVSDRKDITIVDSEQIHYYQPGFTKVGGGVYPYHAGSLVEYEIPKITGDYTLFPHKALQVIPEQNKVTTNAGDMTYDTLILSPGLEVNYGAIPGLEDLLENEDENVVSIYKYKYALKTARKRVDFKGGAAYFTQPSAPIKCAGAPQKIMYLSDAYWKNNGIIADCHFMTPLPSIFGVKYYSDALEKIADEKKLIRHYKQVLTSFKNNHVATFKNPDNGELTDYNFDFIHVVPPMRAPELLRNSPSICDSTSFVDVDSSLRHTKYPNIWAIGDCTNLPNAKTAAAIFSQSPVLVANLKENSTDHKYGGYSACPLFLGNHELMLAEFKIYKNDKGVVVTEPDETFAKGGQTRPGVHYYWLTWTLGHLYNISLKGKWFGKNSLINPISKKGLNEVIIISLLISFGCYILAKKRSSCSKNN